MRRTGVRFDPLDVDAMASALELRAMRLRIQIGATKSAKPHRFAELADYNTRIHKGILHAPGYVERMAEEQRAFNEWAARGYNEDDLPPPPAPSYV